MTMLYQLGVYGCDKIENKDTNPVIKPTTQSMKEPFCVPTPRA